MARSYTQQECKALQRFRLAMVIMWREAMQFDDEQCTVTFRTPEAGAQFVAILADTQRIVSGT